MPKCAMMDMAEKRKMMIDGRRRRPVGVEIRGMRSLSSLYACERKISPRTRSTMRVVMLSGVNPFPNPQVGCSPNVDDGRAYDGEMYANVRRVERVGK